MSADEPDLGMVEDYWNTPGPKPASDHVAVLAYEANTSGRRRLIGAAVVIVCSLIAWTAIIAVLVLVAR